MRSRWLILPLLLLCAAQMRADTVTLNTGEKITGTIKTETPTEITIEIPVSATITDERVIQKQDIKQIDKPQPDQIAYERLIQIQPSPELSFSQDAYTQILASLNAFQAQYPNSTYLPEIKKLADAFQNEKKHVDAGEIKYMGQWLSKDEAAQRAPEIRGLELYGAMQQQAAAGNLVGAMQTFDSLEHDSIGTRSYPAAVTLARQVLLRLQRDLVTRMAAVQADQQQLKNTIAFTAEPEKTQLIASAKADQDRMNETIDAAIKSGVKWVPLLPRCQVSIDTLQKTTSAELTRLGTTPIDKMNQSVADVDTARAAILNGDLKNASTLLAEASQLWSANADALYLTNELKSKMATPTPAPIAAATPVSLNVPHATPRPVAVAAASSPVGAPAADDNKPFYMTPSGAIAIAAAVLIIGGILASVSQRKARQQAAE